MEKSPLIGELESDFQRRSALHFSLNCIISRNWVNCIKMNALPRFLYLFQCLLVFLSKSFSRSLDKVILTFLWDAKIPRAGWHALIFGIIIVGAQIYKKLYFFVQIEGKLLYVNVPLCPNHSKIVFSTITAAQSWSSWLDVMTFTQMVFLPVTILWKTFHDDQIYSHTFTLFRPWVQPFLDLPAISGLDNIFKRLCIVKAWFQIYQIQPFPSKRCR